MDSNNQKYTIAEAIEAAQEALRRAYVSARMLTEHEEPTNVVHDVGRYLVSYVVFNRVLFALSGVPLQIGTRATYDLQNAGLQTLLTLSDAATVANRAWFELVALFIRTSQDSIVGLVTLEAGVFDAAERDADP
ncbi:MAG: hypothetical protein HY675_17365 [Chloroflexi bacterium]|nr:hypothetical protein [Chloroflexota bacterium]